MEKAVLARWRRGLVHALVMLPLSAIAQGVAHGPEAPRMLDWGSFADEGQGVVSRPIAPMPTLEAEPSRPEAPKPGAKRTAPALEFAPPTLSALPEAIDPADPASHDFVERTVSKALAISPDVREAESRWRAAQYDIDEIKGQRMPQVQVGAATPSATFGTGTNDSARNAIGTVQVTTPVYDWGRISRTIESRTETAEAERARMLQVRQQVAYDTVNALIELRRNQQMLALTDIYVARMTELVDMLAEIVRIDRGRDSELVQARGRRLQALASRDLVTAKLREVRISLLKLVGEEVKLPPTLKWNPAVLDAEEALAAAHDHPALLQARAEANAATLNAKSVRASLYPQLNWVISKTTQQDAYGNVQPWSTGLSLQWNAFQGGSGTAAEKAAYGRAQASEDKAAVATRDLEYRLRTSAQQRDAALSRVEEYTPLIKDSDRVRKAFFEQWYHLGRRTLLDVLIAEAELYTNQSAQVNSRFDAEAADLRMRADAAVLLPWVFAGRTGVSE